MEGSVVFHTQLKKEREKEMYGPKKLFWTLSPSITTKQLTKIAKSKLTKLPWHVFGMPGLVPLLMSGMKPLAAALSRTNEPQASLRHVTGFSHTSQDSNGTGLFETCVSHQRGLIPGCQEGSERLPREIRPQPSHQSPWWHPKLKNDSPWSTAARVTSLQPLTRNLSTAAPQLHFPCSLEPAVVLDLTDGWRQFHSEKYLHQILLEWLNQRWYSMHEGNELHLKQGNHFGNLGVNETIALM